MAKPKARPAAAAAAKDDGEASSGGLPLCAAVVAVVLAGLSAKLSAVVLQWMGGGGQSTTVASTDPADFVPFAAPGGGSMLGHFSRAHNESLLWGTWRPGVLFGAKSRTSPDSVVAGLMWTAASEKEGTLRIDPGKLRHTCEESETRDGLHFGYAEHDGSGYGRQVITDPGNKLTLRTSFYKQGPHNWAMRVAGNSSKGKKALFFYLAIDEELAESAGSGSLRFEVGARGGGAGSISGSTPSLGAFRLSLVPRPGSLATVGDDGLEVVPWAAPAGTAVVDLKQALLRGLRGGAEGPEAPKRLSLLRTPPPSAPSGAPAVVVQLLVEQDFEVDFVFEGASAGASPAPSGEALGAALDDASAQFRRRFGERFHLERAGLSEDKVEFARSSLSALLGGLGFFYGRSKVKLSTADGGTIETPPRPLFTAVPSRSFFPRGFLWDEGFHQLLVGRWSPSIARDAIAHWFGTMREDGWVPREQILGKEALSKVPDWAVPQHPTHANPPTMLLAIEALLNDAAGGGQDDAQDAAATSRWLSALLPAVERWFEWFRTSQAGVKKESFRWHGRDPNDGKLNAMTLSSGLDDYPRASSVSDNERHVDLHSWIAFGAGVLARVAERAGEPKAKVEGYRRMQQQLVRALDEMHWDPNLKRFCDFGLHSNDGKFVPHVVVKCGKPDGSSSVEHALAKDIYGQLTKGNAPAGTAPCPAEHPKFLFPLGDGQGGLLMRERFVPKTEKLQFVDHTGYVSLFPLFLRLLPPDSPRLPELLDLLGDPKRGLWSDFGLRSLAKGDKMYLRDNAPGDAPYWRGPIWINCNFLAVSALKHYAAEEGPSKQRAAELLKSLSANLVDNMFQNFKRTGFLWEQYNPHDGAGQRTHPFNGWSSLVVLMMGD